MICSDKKLTPVSGTSGHGCYMLSSTTHMHTPCTEQSYRSDTPRTVYLNTHSMRLEQSTRKSLTTPAPTLFIQMSNCHCKERAYVDTSCKVWPLPKLLNFYILYFTKWSSRVHTRFIARPGIHVLDSRPDSQKLLRNAAPNVANSPHRFHHHTRFLNVLLRQCHMESSAPFCWIKKKSCVVLPAWALGAHVCRENVKTVLRERNSHYGCAFYADRHPARRSRTFAHASLPFGASVTAPNSQLFTIPNHIFPFFFLFAKTSATSNPNSASIIIALPVLLSAPQISHHLFCFFSNAPETPVLYPLPLSSLSVSSPPPRFFLLSQPLSLTLTLPFPQPVVLPLAPSALYLPLSLHRYSTPTRCPCHHSHTIDTPPHSRSTFLQSTQALFCVVVTLTYLNEIETFRFCSMFPSSF